LPSSWRSSSTTWFFIKNDILFFIWLIVSFIFLRSINDFILRWFICILFLCGLIWLRFNCIVIILVIVYFLLCRFYRCFILWLIILSFYILLLWLIILLSIKRYIVFTLLTIRIIIDVILMRYFKVFVLIQWKYCLKNIGIPFLSLFSFFLIHFSVIYHFSLTFISIQISI
jgi:hypothetical protein